MNRLIIVIFLICSGISVSGESLYIPELLDGTDAVLKIQEGKLELDGSQSSTLGYNGNYLGPTLRFFQGDWADIKVQNSLKEETTLHWHGMHIPAEFDGGPHQVIPAGGNWNPRFQIRQNAATLWYHPHLMGKTAEQVYKGLAGMIIIEDDFSKNLNIPSDYGVDDIPLILQDRRVDSSGQFRYRPAMPDIMHGYSGNVLLTNGQVYPEIETEGGIIRFRILNGSNSSLMRIRFESGKTFRVIASDGGFLPVSADMDEIILSPGERFELLADFSQKGSDSLICDVLNVGGFKALQIESSGRKKGSMEEVNTNRDFIIPGETDIGEERYFKMETGGMRNFTINSRTMDMKRIDFEVPGGQAEVWTVENVSRGMMQILHSFHVHDVQFRIIDIDGNPPPDHLAGPKDTVFILPGETVRFILNFQDYNGIYMYHCHFLEHEDNGMMGQFEVIQEAG
ncbi:MAG: multicopper oxidase domain-containing protein [Spirochaetales bacterium]|nr:multicopper oxidase domain-containing protein [Spirochaetales bacterium]